MMWRTLSWPETLHPDEVHLWRVPLRIPMDLPSLSSDEAERARRFRVEAPCQAFTRVRQLLRLLSGAYLGVAPDAIRFAYAERGKPYVQYPRTPSSFRFNVSHSGDWGLLAFTWDREIGADIEAHNPKIEVLLLANRFFSPDEVAELRAQSSDEHDQTFYNAWTRKEAYMKGKAEGLAMPLDSFSVSLDNAEAPVLRRSGTYPEDVERWALYACRPQPGYTAAVALEVESRAGDWFRNHPPRLFEYAPLTVAGESTPR